MSDISVCPACGSSSVEIKGHYSEHIWFKPNETEAIQMEYDSVSQMDLTWDIVSDAHCKTCNWEGFVMDLKKKEIPL